MRSCWIAVCLSLVPTAGWAVQANPTRPTFSDTANPMARGYLELEAGGQFWYSNQFATPVMLKLGATRDFELKLGADGLRVNDDEVGFGTMALFAKYRFLRQRSLRPALSAMVGLGLPTASDNVGGGPMNGTDTTNLSLLFLMTGQFGPMSWDINTGIDIINLGEGDTWVDIPLILTLSTVFYRGFGAALEFSDYIPLSDQPNQANVLGALFWRVFDRLVLDIAFVKGFDGAPDWQILLGATVTLTRLW